MKCPRKRVNSSPSSGVDQRATAERARPKPNAHVYFDRATARAVEVGAVANPVQARFSGTRSTNPFILPSVLIPPFRLSLITGALAVGRFSLHMKCHARCTRSDGHRVAAPPSSPQSALDHNATRSFPADAVVIVAWTRQRRRGHVARIDQTIPRWVRCTALLHPAAGFQSQTIHRHCKPTVAAHSLLLASMTRPFNPLDHPEAEVSRAYFCQLAGRSKMTAYRHERSDPHWPKPIIRSGRVFYKAIDCKRYLQSAVALEVSSDASSSDAQA